MESRAAEGKAYSYLGNDHFKLGNLEEAIAYHELQLHIFKGSRKQA